MNRGRRDCVQIVLIGTVSANVVILAWERWPAAGRGAKVNNKKKPKRNQKHNQGSPLYPCEKQKEKQDDTISTAFFGVFAQRFVGLEKII